MKARVCLLMAGLVVVGACGSSDSGSADGSGTTAPVETTAVPATDTSHPPTTASPTTAVDEPPTTAGDSGGGDVTGGGVVTVDSQECSSAERGGRTEAPTLMVVDRATGDLLWQMCPDGLGEGMAAVEAGGMVVYSGFVTRLGDGADSEAASSLVGFDAATGDIAWTLEGESSAIVGASDDVVYLRGTTPESTSDPATVLDPVIAIDPATGEELWRVDQTSLALFPDGYGDTFIVSQGADDLALRALEAQTGEERWRAEALGPFAVRDRGVIVHVGESVGEGVAVLDPDSGEVTWTADGSPVWASEETVYVSPDLSTSDVEPRQVEARSIVDGRVLATFDLPGAPDPSVGQITTQGTPGDVIFSFGGTGLVAVDGADGSTLWTPDSVFIAGLDGDTVVDTTGGPGLVSIVDARTGDTTGEVEIPCLAAGGPCTVGYVAAIAMTADHLILTVSNSSGA